MTVPVLPITVVLFKVSGVVIFFIILIVRVVMIATVRPDRVDMSSVIPAVKVRFVHITPTKPNIVMNALNVVTLRIPSPKSRKSKRPSRRTERIRIAYPMRAIVR